MFRVLIFVHFCRLYAKCILQHQLQRYRNVSKKMMEICNCHCFFITKAQKAQYSSKMLESFVILIRRNRSDYCLVSIDLITGVFL